MSYKASIISKIIKKFKRAVSGEGLGVSKKNKLSEQVGKWLAGEGRNFITMATL